MNKIILSVLLSTAALSQPLFAEETTIDNQFRISIPNLLFLGDDSRYKVEMNYNGSCWVPEKIEPIVATIKTDASMGHGGFDFSTGLGGDVQGSGENTTDGYATLWASSNYPSGHSWGTGVWYNSNEYQNISSIDKGVVALDSISRADFPSDWAKPTDHVDYPLQVDHVYLVKAADGFAAFKVKSLYPDAPVDPNDSGDSISNIKITMDYVFFE